MICPNCHNEVRADAKFCNKCGFHLVEAASVESSVESSGKTCKKCGAELKQDAKFCIKCGTPVNETPSEEVIAGMAQKKKKSGAVFMVILIILIVALGTVGVLM